MNKVVSGFKTGFIFIILTVFLSSCENDYPQSIYDAAQQYKPNPVITGVTPESALAGIDIIEISGNNFSPVKEENRVYFNTARATVLSASSTMIQVQAPNTPADSIVIKVSVDGALSFAEWSSIKLDVATIEYGGYGSFDDAWGIALDKGENLYISILSRRIDKVTPDGTRQENYGTPLFLRANHMKWGPGGYLYMARANRILYRIPPGGGSSEIFSRGFSGTLYDLDFDLDGNIYTAGNGDNLFIVDPDGANKIVADYPDTYLRCVRVFNGYVYVGGRVSDGQEAIWRNQIISADSLGPNEMVFDWSDKIGSTSGILSLTFSADGDMYIGTDGSHAIVVVHMDGSHEPLYPGVLEPESYDMSWGNGSYLYVSRRNSNVDKKRIIRINMLKDGAPYYGRQ